MSECGLRSHKIYLLNNTISQILGSKLPSRRQVLQLMYHHLIELKQDAFVSGKHVAIAIKAFWDAAGIATMEPNNVQRKILKLNDDYKAKEKASKNRLQKDTDLFKTRETIFINELDDLFDIASSDLSTTSEESKHFLMQQRMKGRPGNITFKFTKETASASETLDESSLGASNIQETSDPSILSSGSSIPSSRSIDDPDFDISEYEKTSVPIPPVILNKNFYTPRLMGELDRYKVSDYAALHIFIAMLLGLGLDPNKFTCSKTSIHDARSKQRTNIGQEIKQKFISKAERGSTVHWDGKQMENITSKEKHERLPVKLTNKTIDQLLGVPEIEDGTGYQIAKAVYHLLENWGQLDNVQMCCYDTTSSNTGCWEGASVHLEQMLGRSLLNTPCRHHISEIMLRAAFEMKVEKSSSPDVNMFKTFRDNWNQIKQDRYKSGLRFPYVKKQLADENLVILKIWITNQMKKKICRHDYRELLELSLLFLGEELSIPEKRKVTFRPPGPVHHARWMAKLLYSFKMFMFREQIELTEEQKIGLADICVFAIRFYLVFWFRCTRAIEAPLQDLTFLRNVYLTRSKDKKLADEVIRKFINHLWYLSEENIGFAFFDKMLPVPVKREMVKRLSYETHCEPAKKLTIDLKYIAQFVESEMSDFVTANTMKFFDRFDINTEFLEHDPALWTERDDYNEARNRLKLVKVVNDTAERSVKVMSDYNKILSKNEPEKQWILIVISKFTQMYKSHYKKDLILDEDSE